MRRETGTAVDIDALSDEWGHEPDGDKPRVIERIEDLPDVE